MRKLARDLGVDLAAVTATGPDGSVTRDDVMAAADGSIGSRRPEARQTGERETRIPVKGVRKMTAQAMVSSAFTAPHVTEWVTIDVTRTMELVDRLRTNRDFAGVKVSPLLVLAKALILAVRRHPGVNATWDEQAQEIVVKNYVNLGIAAATPRGLVVPNIKDADDMTLLELAEALNQLTATAREGRTQPAEMAGGTITITNVGVFGVDSGTPIINPGESAILCFGAVRDMPWVHDGEIAIRKVTQLALSFDHRLIDGALGLAVPGRRRARARGPGHRAALVADRPPSGRVGDQVEHEPCGRRSLGGDAQPLVRRRPLEQLERDRRQAGELQHQERVRPAEPVQVDVDALVVQSLVVRREAGAPRGRAGWMRLARRSARRRSGAGSGRSPAARVPRSRSR